MSDQTYHMTRQDLRKTESRIAAQHGGNPPADCDVSAMKVGYIHPQRSVEVWQTRMI